MPCITLVSIANDGIIAGRNIGLCNIWHSYRTATTITYKKMSTGLCQLLKDSERMRTAGRLPAWRRLRYNFAAKHDLSR